MMRTTLGLWALLLYLQSAVGASVTIDPTQDRHYIPDLIYGMNFASDNQITEADLPLTRWGGNAVTSYNYLIDVASRGFDYFFEKLPSCWDYGCNPQPTDPKTNSASNKFLDRVAAHDISVFFTVPTIGWVPKTAVYNHNFPCGFPANLFPNQDCFDPYEAGSTRCGSGTFGGDVPGICGGSGFNFQFPYTVDRTLVNIQIDPSWIKTWIEYLVSRYGPSNGKRIYQLDNEPNLWSSTHNDIHPTALSYDELWTAMRDYAVAILEADPTALIAGPAEWGWPNYFCSNKDLKESYNGNCSANSVDRAAHGGLELVAWLLQQAADYERQHGQRILHYLDLHYYPQGGNAPDNIQSLWNPQYTDPSWISANINLLPRMRSWVDNYYPGTKISLSEYSWGSNDQSIGAVAYALVLGYFGQYQLDAATIWGPPGTDEIAFAAFKLYRNYDGQGGKFFPTSIRASVSGATDLMAFASVGASSLTTVLVNTNAGASVACTITFGNFEVSGSMATWWMHDGTSTNSDIVKQSDPTIASDKSVTLTLPPYSINMLVVQGTPGPGGGPLNNTSSNSNTSNSSSSSGTLFLSIFLPLLAVMFAMLLL